MSDSCVTNSRVSSTTGVISTNAAELYSMQLLSLASKNFDCSLNAPFRSTVLAIVPLKDP